MELKPGERIIEANLAREMGVSRAPVREAIRILHKYRIVEMIPRKGSRVVTMSESLVIWLYDVAGELLSLVARRGIEHGDEDEFKNLNEALQILLKSANAADIKGFLQAVTEYAFVSARGTKNPFLVAMITDMWPLARMVLYAAISGGFIDIVKTADLFKQTFQQLERRDPDSAAKVVRKLVEYLRECSLQMLMESSKAM
jgi:DNA-binding GntR family transcriptional regulator